MHKLYESQTKSVRLASLKMTTKMKLRKSYPVYKLTSTPEV